MDQDRARTGRLTERLTVAHASGVEQEVTEAREWVHGRVAAGETPGGIDPAVSLVLKGAAWAIEAQPEALAFGVEGVIERSALAISGGDGRCEGLAHGARLRLARYVPLPPHWRDEELGALTTLSVAAAVTGWELDNWGLDMQDRQRHLITREALLGAATGARRCAAPDCYAPQPEGRPLCDPCRETLADIMAERDEAEDAERAADDAAEIRWLRTEGAARTLGDAS